MLELLSPFSYSYMVKAMFVSSFVGALCGFLSAYLMLKGWSLIGDALSHSIVPGIASAFIIGVPFSIGAFLAGSFAVLSMLILKKHTSLKEDVIIGLIFSSFFGLGLFMISLFPMSVDIQLIIFGNILAISPVDAKQLMIIGIPSFVFLCFKWKDLMVTFFDEDHARTVGLNTEILKVLFFIILSLSSVAALQTVGAFLVIALVVTPGATAYLMTDKFQNLLIFSIFFGGFSCFLGAYLSFFIDGATGGLIILLQTGLFLSAFFIAPKYGFISIRLRLRGALIKKND